MNRRIKTEGSSDKKLKHSRSIKKTKTLGTKKSPRKRSSICFVRESSSDKEFELPVSIQKNNYKQTGALKKNTKQKGCIQSIGSPSTILLKNVNKRSSLNVKNVYEISDSSDDELNNFMGTKATTVEYIDLCGTENDTTVYKNLSNKKILKSEVENIDLCRTQDDAVAYGINISDEEILISQDKKTDSCYPSTSKNKLVSPNVTNDVTEFIDNLLDSNKDLLNENCLKSLKELNEETDKLLASSWELIRKEEISHTEDSVMYVCTEKDPVKQPVQKDGSHSIQEISKNLAKQPQEKQKLKAYCPICLEALGENPVSATTCGHTFCTACIESCIKSTRKCPTCRKRLTKTMTHPLFLF